MSDSRQTQQPPLRAPTRDNTANDYDADLQIEADIEYKSNEAQPTIPKQAQKETQLSAPVPSAADEGLMAPTSASLHDLRIVGQLNTLLKNQKRLYKELQKTKAQLNNSMTDMREYVGSSFYNIGQDISSDESEDEALNIRPTKRRRKLAFAKKPPAKSQLRYK